MTCTNATKPVANKTRGVSNAVCGSPGRLHLEFVALVRVSLEHRRSQVLLSHLPVPRAHQHVYAINLKHSLVQVGLG